MSNHFFVHQGWPAAYERVDFIPMIFFQTLGISSSDSVAAEQSTDTSQRSHESAPGQNVEGIIGASSKNYFAQFLSSGKE